jgi:SAM-dependent methyltransferase
MRHETSTRCTDQLFEGGLVPGHAQSSMPSPWVSAWLEPADRAGSTALDVACGKGRHVRLAHERGYDVTGVDRTAATGVEGFTQFLDPGQRAGVRLIATDLEDGAAWPWARDPFDVVIVTNYLWRPRLPDIVGAVARDGMLIYETFAAGNERFGKPSNPDFLLQPGELLEVVRGRLVPFAFEHRVLDGPRRCVQRIVAVGSQHAWVCGGCGPMFEPERRLLR